MSQASNDFRVHVGFFRHRKTLKLRRRLGDAGIVALLTIWAYATENHPDGCLGRVSDEDLADMAGWHDSEHPAAGLMEALDDAGWIDIDDGVVSLHDWDQHQPWVAGREKRSASARHAARMRWASESHAEGNAGANAVACPSPLPSLPNPTDPKSGAPARKRSPTQRDRLVGVLRDGTGKGVQKCREALRMAERYGHTLDEIEAQMRATPLEMSDEWPDRYMRRIFNVSVPKNGTAKTHSNPYLEELRRRKPQ